jgi:hypothetical protein
MCHVRHHTPHTAKFTDPPVIACRKEILNVPLRANFTEDCGRMCRRDKPDNAVSYALETQHAQPGLRAIIYDAYVLPSAVTHAAIVDTGIADSNHSKFITNCRSKGPKRLHPSKCTVTRRVTVFFTGKLIDMMKVFGIGVSEYSETATARK